MGMKKLRPTRLGVTLVSFGSLPLVSGALLGVYCILGLAAAVVVALLIGGLALITVGLLAFEVAP